MMLWTGMPHPTGKLYLVKETHEPGFTDTEKEHERALRATGCYHHVPPRL